MIYTFAIIFSIIFIIFIVNLVRKKKLDEKFSILWLIASMIILIIAIFPSIIKLIAQKLNVAYPSILMLLFAIIVLGTYIVHITTVITKQNKMIVKLTQELGILKEEIQEQKRTKN